MKKNVASQSIGCQMITAADGSAFTSAVTVYVTGDNGAQGAGSVGSGACTHEGNGYHSYAPAQAETNYSHVAFTFIGTGAIPATVQVYPNEVEANLALTLADTNELQTDWVNGGRLDLILDARASQTSVDDVPTNAELATALGTADDAVLAAVAALNNLSAGQVRTELSTELGRIDVAVSTRLASASYAAPLDAAGTRTAVGLATANLDTQLGDLPTNAELATALGTADDAVLAAITSATSPLATAANLATVAGYLDTEVAAILEDTGTTIPAQISALNNLSSAQVTAAVPTAAANAAAVLAAATANPIDANVQEVNDVALTGDGGATPWGPA
jgi:hypothetical protein